MEIKVLGPGCPRCEQTAKVIKEAVAESGIEVQVEKVTDIKEIMQQGVMTTPAVVVDGEVKIAGQVPGKAEVLAWLKAGQ
jgi:small redox-active disulfide protein 2